ncbi:MAG: ATP-grasp domain-containing protein, partial [Phycisphaerae bacterium]
MVRQPVRSRPRGKPRVRLLFSCVGRRVELIRAFRRAAARLDVALAIHGCDTTPLAPAMHCVDRAHLVPPIADNGYIDALVALAEHERINLLIPLLDLELVPIAAAVDRFAAAGCRALVSSESVVRTCRDKLATCRALQAAGIDTPKTWAWTDAITRKRHRFPYFLKPRAGSAAMGNYVVRTRDELHTFGLRVPDAIVQEYIAGAEHTLDVYTGFDGRPRYVVPRKRLEVRTGEVSKGLIVKDPHIMDVGRRVADMLEACRGVVTVQCIVA